MSTPKTGRPRAGRIVKQYTIGLNEFTWRRLAPKRARKTNPDGLYPPIPKPLPPHPQPPLPPAAVHNESCICVLCEQHRRDRDRILSAGVKHD